MTLTALLGVCAAFVAPHQTTRLPRLHALVAPQPYHTVPDTAAAARSLQRITCYQPAPHPAPRTAATARSAQRITCSEVVVVEAAVETLLEASVNWNFVLVGVALAFGGLFEYAIETLEERIPKRLLPVLQQSVVEFATLGFIGLIIESINHGENARFLRGVSERFLGEEDFLIERFEEIHQGLFDTTILYFGACTLLILRISAQFREWDYERRNSYLRFKLAEYEWKQDRRLSVEAGRADGAEQFALRGWSQAARKMEITPMAEGLAGVGWLEELSASYETRVAEFLRFRERFIEQSRSKGTFLPSTFSFSEYLEDHAAKNLRELVSIEPVTLAYAWAPIALLSWTAELVGLEVLGADEVSPVLAVFGAAQFVLGGWAVGNFWKMRQLKALLRPQLTKRWRGRGEDASTLDGTVVPTDGNVVRRLLPPAYALAGGMPAGWGALFGPLSHAVEQPFAAPPRNRHERLFGTVGANGPQYYLQSQKLVLFNSIVSIAVCGALLSDGEAASYPLLYCALLPPALTIALAPVTFLMYNWVTAVEELKDMEALREALKAQRERQFQAKLKTLSKLCDCFEAVSSGRRFLAQSERIAWQELRDNGNPDALLNLLTIFDLADTDADGTISRKEICEIASNLGYDLTPAAVSSFFEQASLRPCEGKLTVAGSDCDLILFREFATFVLSSRSNRDAAAHELAARGDRLFAFFDANNSSEITIEEMTVRLQKMGFDTAGTEQLFVDITGMPQNTISRSELSSYVVENAIL